MICWPPLFFSCLKGCWKYLLPDTGYALDLLRLLYSKYIVSAISWPKSVAACWHLCQTDGSITIVDIIFLPSRPATLEFAVAECPLVQCTTQSSMAELKVWMHPFHTWLAGIWVSLWQVLIQGLEPYSLLDSRHWAWWDTRALSPGFLLTWCSSLRAELT